MTKSLALAFLIGGIIIFLVGVNTSHDLGLTLIELFTIKPFHQAIALVISGSILTILGISALPFSR
jgi:hypothetical protein